MKLLAPWLLAAALSACVSTPGVMEQAPEVDPDGEWKAYILPTSDELGHEALPWLPTFGEGMLAASEQQRPLLFWAMNGHPLGCT